MTQEETCRVSELINEMSAIRDRLDPIVKGEIDRGHCIGGREVYGAMPGTRKTFLKDAVSIAKTVQIRIDRAIGEFEKEGW